jgi:peroxiredoxin
MLIDILLALIFISVWVGFYQIVKQQGRILLRLDQLEARQLAEVPGSAGSAMPIGRAFPTFKLPGLDGNVVSLADYRGKQVLLIHWNPDCGFCESIAPELAHLEEDLLRNNTRLLLLAAGTNSSNRTLIRKHGLQAPVLLLDGHEMPAPFEHTGTPVAYLLDAEGCVLQPFAEGAEAVPALAHSIVPDARRLPGEKPLSESRIIRDGLKPGTPAPGFRLKNIHGGLVSLEDYRGCRVLLVFSDPHCGPCDALAPQLGQLHKAHANHGLVFIMIGRGDVQENRRKAKQYGIEFPIALQDQWKLSKEYGIFATPVAFLIGEDGIILANVAVGTDAIRELALQGLGKGKDLEHALSS